MEHTSAAFDHYQSSFPSDAFLKKYFGRNRRLKRVLLDTLLPYIGQRETLHQHLRHRFDGVLRCGCMHLIRAADRAENGFEKIYAFKDYRCSDWARRVFEEHDLGPELTTHAERALCTEFIQNYKSGAFSEDHWWQWFTSEGTIGIEVLPAALPKGGNRTRTLEEFFEQNSEDE